MMFDGMETLKFSSRHVFVYDPKTNFCMFHYCLRSRKPRVHPRGNSFY